MTLPAFVRSSDLDPRLTPARPDLAASWLQGTLTAEKFVAPKRHCISVPVTSLYRSPGDTTQPIETQVIYGEAVDVYEVKDGWAWIQNSTDGYVGYIDAHALGPMPTEAATHRVSNIGAYIYNTNNVKTTPRCVLGYGSLLHVVREATGQDKEPMYALADGGFVPRAQVSPLNFTMDDPVAEAFRFLGVPRLWGGRSHLGLDCSSLVQLVYQACGLTCPRDADHQEQWFGKPIDRSKAQGGDLVFWRGHVAMMIDDSTIIHSNDRSASVSIDDLDEYLAWRASMGKSPLKLFKRVG